MKRLLKHLCLMALLAFALPAQSVRAADYYVLPFDVDPPIEIDGDLNDWSNVPNAIIIDRAEHATYGLKEWQGPRDLSARIRLAWRQEGLFVAAEVTDDVVFQPLTGPPLWKADHMAIWMDFTPGEQPQRTMFGKGQFQFGLSPGNFGGTAGGGGAVPPAIQVWHPARGTQKGGKVVSRRTDTGYVIEAFVPFSRLDVTGVRINKDANIAVAVSDCDDQQPIQQTMLTYSVGRWANKRFNLLPMVFGDGNGKGVMPPRTVKIAEKAELASLQSKTFTFKAEPIPEGKEPYIFFKARIHSKAVAGYYTGSLAVALNGKRIDGKRLANRPMMGIMIRGDKQRSVLPDGRMSLPYAPDYVWVDRHPRYAIIDAVKAAEFEFEVDGLLKEGDNQLVFTSLAESTPKSERKIVLGDVALRIRSVVPPAPPPKPAPMGSLPVVEPQKEFPKTYTNLKAREGSFSFVVNGERMTVTSRFSTPDGKWNRGSNRYYAHKRVVREHNEWIEVRHTFRNLTKDDVPILQVYTCDLGDRVKGIWLAGVKIPGMTGQMGVEANPSVVGVTLRSGVGMVALNDEFRVHITQAANKGDIELADRTFVLKAGATYTAELAVVPVKEPDFYAVLNAARRMLDVNFTIKYMFAFLGHDVIWARGTWTDAMLKNFIEGKSPNLVGIHVRIKYKGRRAHGVAWRMFPDKHKTYRDFHNRLNALFPGRLKTQVYYHSYIDVMDENVETYKECRALDETGKQMDYGTVYYRLYVPTVDNAWGKQSAKTVDLILDTIGADGVYWDEFNRSRAKYVYNMWDGCSGDIDPGTFQLKRKKGAVALLSRDYCLQQAKRIMARGPLVTNGAPHTRALARLKYQCFTETGSITNCHRVLLYTPVALGDHLTERSEEDAYKVMMQALDYGCLYSWYSQVVIPKYKTITEYMFPFTPLELHRGTVIGEERILTNRSGLFGWGDRSDFEAHVYDHTGRGTGKVKVKEVERNGKTYAEVRLPEGYSAAIVRVKK